jgi:hypothetical protein
MSHSVIFLVDVCTLARLLGFSFLICDARLLVVPAIDLKRKYLEPGHRLIRGKGGTGRKI